jgi:lipid-A-disaccharide synthase
MFENILKQYNFKSKLYHDSRELMKDAKIGVVRVGTTALEAALLNMNTIAIYKASLTHYIVGKLMINLRFISLPNILANKLIIPELIQKKAHPKNISEAVIDFLNDKDKCLKQKQDFSEMRKLMTRTEKVDMAKKILDRLSK